MTRSKAALGTCLVLLTAACGCRRNQPENQPRPANAGKQHKKEPLPDDPVSKEARAAAGKILDRLLTGKLEEDESGLATRANALKGFKSWSIESQKKAEQGRSTLEGIVTGPSGQARFSMTIVKQGSGKWMVGVFSGPNPVE